MKKLLLALLFLASSASSQTVIKIKHQRYTTAYNTQLNYPILVTWKITAANVCRKGTAGYVSRDSSRFVPDPRIPGLTNLQQYYDKDNPFNPHKWQRGHNCPANDNSCSKVQMDECHYFSNMTPQNASLNEHRWALLEAYASKLAKRTTVRVWCGSYGEIEKMGAVSVPKYCWKILKYGTSEEVYIFPNVDTVMRHPYGYYKQPTAAGVARIRDSTGLLLRNL